MAIHMGFFLTAMFGALPTFLDSMEIVSYVEWWGTALFAGLILAGVWLAMLLWLFSGTSWAGWVLADYLLAGLIGILITTGYGLRKTNILLDTKPPTLYDKPIVERSCTLTCSRTVGSGKRRRTESTTHFPTEAQCEAPSRQQTVQYFLQQDYKCSYNNHFNYRLVVEPWCQGSKKPYHFNTNSQLFDAVRRGTIMTIPSHPGRFGIEWVDIDSIQPAR